MFKFRLVGLEYKYTLNVRAETLSAFIDDITKFVRNYMPVHPGYLKPDLEVLRNITYSIKISILEPREVLDGLEALIKDKRWKVKVSGREYEVKLPEKVTVFVKASDRTLDIHFLMHRINLYETLNVKEMLDTISRFVKDKRVVIVGNLSYIDTEGVSYFAYYQLSCLEGEGVGIALIRTEA